MHKWWYTIIGGYVVVSMMYDRYGWFGCTMAVDAEAGSVTVKFLHPHLPVSMITAGHRTMSNQYCHMSV